MKSYMHILWGNQMFIEKKTIMLLLPKGYGVGLTYCY